MNRNPLILVIIVYVILGGLYASRTPKWQAPDEPAHYNYIKTIGDTGSLPVLMPGDYNQANLEEIKAAKFPPAMSIAAIRYESYQPPLYYLLATPVYLAARPGGVDAEVFALRMFSVALEVGVLLLALLIVREIFPANQFLPLATAGLMATIPMHMAVTASISNDTASEFVIALILLLAILRVREKVSDRHFIVGGGVLFGAALLTKSTAYLTGGLVLIAAEWARWYALPRARRTIFPYRHMVALFGISLVIAAPMFLRNIGLYGMADPLGLARHDSVVVGQPTTAQMIAQNGLAHIVFDFFAVTFKSFWAVFGWMGVLVSDRVYVLLFALTAVAALGLFLYVARILRQRESMSTPQWQCLALLALLLVTSVVDYAGYNFKFLQFQGRYLFPAIIPIAFFLVIGLRELLAREYLRFVMGLIYVALVGLDIACLFLYIVPQLRVGG